jgi:C4-dicarboxylate transporter DctM subunit
MGWTWLLFLVVVALAAAAYRNRSVGLTVWLTIGTALFLWTGNTAFMVLGIILSCLLLGQPLYVLMGTLSLACFYFITGYKEVAELDVMVRLILELASKEVLLAIPFFVVAGEIMTQGSLAQRLIDVARAVFGWAPGGLAVAAVAGCVFFAAISGSSPVTVIAIGSIMVPALVRAGYPFSFSIGLLTTAGSLGILIPPSIPMIVYSIMVGTSTPMDPKDLFLGGVIPGLMIASMLSAWCVWTGYKHRLEREPFSFGNIGREVTRGFWSLMLPVIILGGIYSGVFTTTEAAGVSVVYAFAVEMFIHRDMKAKDFVKVGENSMSVMGALLLIIGLAICLNYVLVEEQVPDRMVEWLQTLDLTRSGFLVIVNIFLLVLGMFMDIMSAILIVAPMLAPMASAMDIEPIHMGIVFIVNLEIGYLTPPIGLNLFVASTLFRRGLGEVIWAVLPPLAILFTGLMLITWIPVFSTGLVNVVNGDPLFGKEKPAVVEPVNPDEPKEVTPQPGTGRVKTLQELMQDQKGGAAESGEPGRVKTLQELMQERKQKSEGGEPAPAEPGRVKTLQELMQDQKAKKEAGAEAAAEPSPSEPPRVKTLQELMQDQRAKKQAEGAP